MLLSDSTSSDEGEDDTESQPTRKRRRASVNVEEQAERISFLEEQVKTLEEQLATANIETQRFKELAQVRDEMSIDNYKMRKESECARRN